MADRADSPSKDEPSSGAIPGPPLSRAGRDLSVNRSPSTEKHARARGIRNWVRRGVYVVVALVVGTLIVIAVLPKPIPVERASVTRGVLRVTVDEVGRARVRDRYIISAPLAGNVSRAELRAGDRIRPGTVLARIAPLEAPMLDPRSRTQAEARVLAAAASERQARSAVLRAKLSLEQEKTEADQNRKLAESGSLSPNALSRSILSERLRKEELASAEFAAQMAAYEVAQARAMLARSEPSKALDQIEVVSPISGRVLSVLRESAGVIQAGTQLLEIGDPGALELVSDVLTSDAVSINSGAPAKVVRWGGADLDAHVRLIEPSAFTRISALGVEEQRVHVILDLDAPRASWESLGDGYRVEVRIVTWEVHDATLVPASALFRSGSGFAVFGIEQGRARIRQVELGRSNGIETEVIRGLRAGDPVVLHPSDRVSDGVRVE
ncbi:MAG TPA: HlyD family efflux transporter periplasmic adaptor subunit [Polyangiaceae bacterium]|nr:HlyD family efflux transporter periplasmic adaptor subunit [Polyangiaceae bacterium]